MFYIEKDNKIVLFNKNKEILINTLVFMPQYGGLEIKETDRPIENFRFADTEEYEKELAKKERERLDKLSMTKSDFFDGTIKAFGADQKDLEPVVKSLLDTLPMTDIEKKIAMNNFQNAKDFYRRHELFNILSNREITLEDGQKIKVTGEQWDRFFDETAKRNPEAYKELLPVEELKEETEELLNDNSTNATVLPE